MTLFPYPKLIASSVDPSKISLTVKGLILGLVPVIIFLAKVKGFDLPESSVTEFAETVGNVIESVTAALSGAMVIVGVLRKILVSVGLYKPH